MRGTSRTRIQGFQVRALSRVLDVPRMKRLIEDEAFRGDPAYSLGEMLDELQQGIWREVREGSAIDTYRRNLQRAYLDRVKVVMADTTAVGTDIVPFLRGSLETLRGEIQSGMMRTTTRATRLHLRDCVERIGEILDPAG